MDERPQLIPKIIHQTYVNDTVPERWREAQKSCVDLHEDYEYKVCASCQKDGEEVGRKTLMYSRNRSSGPISSHASS